MDNLEQLKLEGMLNLISELGTLTYEELDQLINSTIIGIA